MDTSRHVIQLHSRPNETNEQHKTGTYNTKDVVGPGGSKQDADQYRHLEQCNDLEVKVPSSIHEHSRLCTNELAQPSLQHKQTDSINNQSLNVNVNYLSICKNDNVITNCSKVVPVEVFMDDVPHKS